MSIGPGDLVVCVDPHSEPFLAPDDPMTARGMAFLKHGRIYSVVGIELHYGRDWLILEGQPDPLGIYDGRRFRKLNDEPDNAKIIEQIKSCHPIKENHHA